MSVLPTSESPQRPIWTSPWDFDIIVFDSSTSRQKMNVACAKLQCGKQPFAYEPLKRSLLKGAVSYHFYNQGWMNSLKSFCPPYQSTALKSTVCPTAALLWKARLCIRCRESKIQNPALLIRSNGLTYNVQVLLLSETTEPAVITLWECKKKMRAAERGLEESGMITQHILPRT